MGVQNLWVLLAPVGRQIEIESLAGQVLAVDASIWLTQFVKAMRDDEGNMIRNAHLLGTLHRVSKLLFYGVRPVFVFDGQTPEIKKRTTARRRKRQEQQTANLRHTAQRILLNRLKQHRQELKKNNGAPAPAIEAGVTLPEASRDKNEDQESIDKEDGSTESIVDVTVESDAEEQKEEKEEEQVWGAAEEDEEDEHLTIDDVDLDTSRLNKIDLHAVFSLPPHLQKDMIQKIMRDRRQEVRDQFIPLAGNPEAYSHTQISAFLQTSALNRRIEAAKRQKKDEEMEEQGGAGLGHSHRIDSNSRRFYIYEKGSERKESEAKDDEEEDVVSEVERYDKAERESVTASTLLDKTNGTQNARADAFKGMERQPLSSFKQGQAGFVPDAAASAVTAAWVARHQARTKQEPLLAIEKLRLDRLKKEEPPSSVNTAPVDDLMKNPVRDVSVSLKLNDIDPGEMTKFKKMFPMSIVEPALATPDEIEKGDDDDDDDVDWEEVAAPVMSSPSQPKGVAHISTKEIELAVESTVLSTKMRASSPKHTEHENGKDGSDDEVDWEDVQDETTSNEPSNGAAVGSVVSVNGEAEKMSNVQTINEEGKDDEDVEDTEELFLTLKNEMEDAKAHEDLDLLKDEALLSAMTTASNLTQWAAGAVRRALEAHTQQHGGRLGTYKSPPAASTMGVTSVDKAGTAEAPVELSDDEDEAKAPPPESTSADVAVIDEEDDRQMDSTMGIEMNDSNEKLQAALAVSIASEQEEEDGGSRVRYLQYTQSVKSPSTGTDSVQQEMDEITLRQEQLELKKLRNRQLRDTEGITDEMVAEVMALLRLFGVPFLVSPMEAEAQCAALEQLGLVDGVITDDSDIFPFGGQRVYKNIFHHQKFVEAFLARDIERELGFSREQVIALALLLGSDYTDGVRGIGIVNATEIAAAYPGIDGLREFKEWVQAFDVAEEANRIASQKKKKKKPAKSKDNGASEEDEDDDDSDSESVRERFQRSHASVRRKWELGDEFPSKHVVQAYMRPQVDRSEARFSWSAPDLAALRNYCTNAFGWDQQKCDGVLQPLEEKAKAAAVSGGRHVQTRLDRFFTSYDDQVHYAQIKSKRLRSAVNQRTGNKTALSKKQRK
ncbi:HhH2 [Phytophthora boehmeriae]|uniref:HhH2 n=1 Tax=Phytophthora boehmeriae TaxID=109152 RepID=A0A8T1VIM5_9STRA|nr:HhH2 [Phytophthora boehmeriae]